jgi:hypothetical protein
LGPQIRALIKAAMSASVFVGMGSSSSATQMITSPIPMKPNCAAGPVCVCVCVCVCLCVCVCVWFRPCIRAWTRNLHGTGGTNPGASSVTQTWRLDIGRLCRRFLAQAHETEVLAGSSRITSDDAATTPTRVPTGLSRAPPTAASMESGI